VDKNRVTTDYFRFLNRPASTAACRSYTIPVRALANACGAQGSPVTVAAIATFLLMEAFLRNDPGIGVTV